MFENLCRILWGLKAFVNFKANNVRMFYEIPTNKEKMFYIAKFYVSKEIKQNILI